MKTKYLITGGAGFIGSNFVHYLFQHKKDIHVTVLDKLTYCGNLENLKEFNKRNDFTFIQGDICDASVVEKAVEGVDIVVNFAAESAVDRSIDKPESFLQTDIIGVYTLLEAARQRPLKRFIQISTDEVYGEIEEGSFAETDETRPRNPYAASKLGGERLAYSYYATYGLPVIITRASNNFGPRTYPEKIIPLFITNLLEGRKVPVYGEGKQIRNWIFVEDHCRGIDCVIEKGMDGEVYNIGGEAELTNLELTKKILELMGKDETFIQFVKDRPGHDFRYSLDSSKLKALGWSIQYPLEEGLQKTIEWYTNNRSWWEPLRQKMDQRYISGFWGKKEGKND